MIDYSQLLYYLILAYRSLGYSAADSQEQALWLVLAVRNNLIEYESIWRRLFNRVQMTVDGVEMPQLGYSEQEDFD